jgi:o-succinylbenzoate---CoA ligase
MNIPGKILIEGKEYNPENIEDLLFVGSNSGDLEWLKEIHSFLIKWFDESRSIEIKTSGSTGEPKVIFKEKSAFVQSAWATIRFFDLKETDTLLLCLPATYIAGKMMLVRAMVLGCNILICKPSAHPFEALQLKVDLTAITPYQLIHSINSLFSSNIGKIIVGGSPVSLQLIDEIQNLEAEIYETYGMTETVSHIALKKLNGADKSENFKLLPGISIRQDNRECLVINAPLLNEGELFTNDIVSLAGTNCFKWLGRVDNVINSGGIKLYPEQIEKAIENAVDTHYFIGSLPDQQFGEQLVLVIEGNEPGSEAKFVLKQKLSEILKPYETPKEIIYLPEFIYTTSGKIKRQEILKSLENN